MTREEIFEGLKGVLSVVKPKMDLSGISEESRLVLDLGLDSLSMLLMSLAIEQKFAFEMKEPKPFETVGSVIDFIAAVKAEQ